MCYGSRVKDAGRLLRGLVALCLAGATGAAARQAASTPPQPVPKAAEPVAHTLFLIGDAGEPAVGGEPVLVSLRRDLVAAAGQASVAFLGDNLYPAGLPAADHAERAEMERRLDAQLDAVRDTGARAVFVPGNHDWQKGGADGWEAVRRQERYLKARGGAFTSFLPGDGCPGPAPVDVAAPVRLVALDTQWWLHSHARPQHPDSSCEADSEAEVLAALRQALAQAGGRDVVVLAHHPLASGGPHGGHFTLRQHLFPLTDVRHGLWLPLPIIGSLYPIARAAGVSPQDQPSGEYQHMRDALVDAAREHPPLAWAAGHEHVLQVIESPRFGRLLVSGAGIFGHTSPVQDLPGSLYRASRSGYMRIDFLADGRRRLAVIEVEKDASSREAFAKPLDGPLRATPR